MSAVEVSDLVLLLFVALGMLATAREILRDVRSRSHA